MTPEVQGNHLTKLILGKVKSEGKLVVAMTSSGIAAMLLSGHRTTFFPVKLPFSLMKDLNLICYIGS